MNSVIKSITNIYGKLSNFGKILLFIAIMLILVVFFRYADQELKNRKEGYTPGQLDTVQTDKFLFVRDEEVYDKFYSKIYDLLVFNSMKNEFEITSIISNTKPTSKSIILDVGSGTGHHVASLSSKGYNVIGIDKSEAMIKEAKERFPNLSFELGDVLNSELFLYNSFTHILCLYFTIYFIKDKRKFFSNCMDWLKHGGTLIIHLVDREKFDPILPSGNPLFIVSPQKYAKKRITHTKITFNEFVYEADFNLNENTNIASFDEKFKFDDGKVRKQTQTLYMEPTEDILSMAQEAGFIVQGKASMVKCAYEHQYLYILVKPS
jgi:SAM-dependent methyltransferase